MRHPPPFLRLSSPPPLLIADAPDALIAMLKPGGSWLFPVQQHLRWLQHVDPDAVTVSDPEDFAPWLTMVQQATHPQHRPTNLGFPQPSTHLTPSMHDVGRRIRPCSRIDNAIRDTHSQYCLMQFWCRSRMMAHLRSSKRCCRGMKTPCSPIDSDMRLRSGAHVPGKLTGTQEDRQRPTHLVWRERESDDPPTNARGNHVVQDRGGGLELSPSLCRTFTAFFELET